MKKIITIAVAAVLVVVMVVALTAGTKAPDATAVRVTTLKKNDLASTISATGTVYSTDSTNVYSNINYPVKTVSVSVGDVVKEGDVLAELDMSSLELDISQKQASISSSQASAQQNLATAQKDLATYKDNAANGYDSSLLNAESAVTTAEMDVKSAEKDVQTAELDIQAANNDLASARRKLRDGRNGEGDYEEAGFATDSQLDSLREAVSAKETALEKAQTNLEKVKQNLEKSKQNLEKAEAGYEAAKVSSSNTIANYEDKVKSAQLNTNFNDQYISVQKLEEDLAKGIITAPASGTVTAVNAVVGGSGNGLLFVIQDAENLKVITNIKEYDIDTVSIGDAVTIKTDATGDKEFTGRLTKIAPTSTLTTNGDTTTSTDSEYESEVSVGSDHAGMRIGMNARMDIITEEHKSVYSVPFEAVVTKGPVSIVYVAKKQPDDSFVAEEVTVTTGLETDLFIEISGDGIEDGVMVISDAEGIEAGMAVSVPQTPAGGGMPDGAGMPGGTDQRSGGMPAIRIGGGPRG